MTMNDNIDNLDPAGKIAAEQRKYRSEHESLWNHEERLEIIKQAAEICRLFCVPTIDQMNLFADADDIPHEGRAAGATSLIGGPNTKSRGDRAVFWRNVTDLAEKWAMEHLYAVFGFQSRTGLTGWLKDPAERAGVLEAAYRKLRYHGLKPVQMADTLRDILECDTWSLCRLSRNEALAALEEWEAAQAQAEDETERHQELEKEKAHMTEIEIENEIEQSETEARNLPAVYTPPTSSMTTSVPTTDGGSVKIDGWGTPYLPGAGGKPLPRIAAGQSDDERFEPASKQLFAIQKVRVTDEKGKAQTENEYIGPFGAIMIVYVVGILEPFGRSRSMMPQPYNPANEALCRSNDGILPDAQFAGKYSKQCSSIDQRSNKLVDVCPMAKWGPKGANGKSTKPACSLSHVICVAFEWQEEWLVAECYFKSVAESAGRNLIFQLGQLHTKGLPLWTVPLKLEILKSGIGYTYTGVLLADSPSNLTDIEEGELRNAVTVWDAAQQFRREQATWTPRAEAEAEADEQEETINTADIPF